MAFLVNDNIIAQKLGGQSGTKPVSPPFSGKVTEVLGGGKYKIHHVVTQKVGFQNMEVFFPHNEVDETELTAAV